MPAQGTNSKRKRAWKKIIRRRKVVMDPSATHDTSPALNYLISSHRTSSFSSLSSSSSVESSISDEWPLSPAVSLPPRFSGVPFSWEHFPGVPKSKLQNCHKKKDSINDLLPLPPPAAKSRTGSRNHNIFDDVGFLRNNRFSSHRYRKDPFVAAFVECAKGRDGGGDGLRTGSTGSVGDRFGVVNLYVSCKKTCAVSDSIVYLPRPRRVPSYDLLNHRTSP